LEAEFLRSIIYAEGMLFISCNSKLHAIDLKTKECLSVIPTKEEPYYLMYGEGNLFAVGEESVHLFRCRKGRIIQTEGYHQIFTQNSIISL